MADPESRPAGSIPDPQSRFGLRFRLWVGCLGGLLVSGAALWWVFAVEAPREGADLRQIALPVLGALGAGLLVSLILASWLQRGIVRRVRDLLSDAAFGQTKAPIFGWGELRDLAAALQTLTARQRQLARTAEEFQLAERQIAAIGEMTQRWMASERWKELPVEEGSLRELALALNRGFGRQAEVLEQNQEAARQVRSELIDTIAEARGVAEQSEHGFVEATALLTTVYELGRLATELQKAIAAGTSGAASDAQSKAYEQWRAAAAGAIEELIVASGASVDHLGRGLQRVQEIGEHVQTLSNRSILIALNVVLAGNRSEGTGEISPERLAGELKQLAREARAATDRVADLAREVEREVRAAGERMQGIRERVALRLEQAVVPAAGPTGPSDETLRLLARAREMIQDAAQKSGRLSSSGESSSRAAQDLVRRLEDQALDLEGLVVRLSPIGPETSPQGPAAGAPPTDMGAAPPHPGGLRLLEDDDEDETNQERRP